MRVRLKIQLASIRDFRWWMRKDELRFTHIVSLMWVRLIGHNVGALALIVGPLNIKLFFGIQAPSQAPGEAT